MEVEPLKNNEKIENENKMEIEKIEENNNNNNENNENNNNNNENNNNNNENENNNNNKNKKEKNSLIRFPLAKIKNIMKLDNDIKLCQKNAYLVIGKLTELFLQEIANNAHKICKNSKRKTINLEDINIAIKQNNKFSFIDINSIFYVDTIQNMNKSKKKSISNNNNNNISNENNIKEKNKTRKKNNSNLINNNNNMTLDNMFKKNNI